MVTVLRSQPQGRGVRTRGSFLAGQERRQGKGEKTKSQRNEGNKRVKERREDQTQTRLPRSRWLALNEGGWAWEEGGCRATRLAAEPRPSHWLRRAFDEQSQRRCEAKLNKVVPPWPLV